MLKLPQIGERDRVCAIIVDMNGSLQDRGLGILTALGYAMPKAVTRPA
ncbi:hypothetical protein [Azospirillum argentinense]